MKTSRVDFMALIYLAIWIPYIAGTRLLSSEPHGGMAVALTGPQILPFTLIFAMLAMYAFLWISRWSRAAHHRRIGSWTFPVPSRSTMLAGVGTAFILTTVPLSLTFPGVSIPFVQVLMRGDALVVAPIVDRINGRKIHWYSNLALVLVAAALAVTIWGRGGLNIPFLCLLTILLNVVGYFLRLMVMTRSAKNADPIAMRRYFTEEQLVAYPVALVIVGALAWMGGVKPLLDLRWGFTAAWEQSAAWLIVPLAMMVAAQGVVAATILLSKHENAYCVPLERSASVIGGVAAAWLLAWTKGYPSPTGVEMIGVGLLIAAIVLLSIGARLKRKTPAEAPDYVSEEAPAQ
jgi:hypothetical protein